MAGITLVLILLIGFNSYYFLKEENYFLGFFGVLALGLLVFMYGHPFTDIFVAIYNVFLFINLLIIFRKWLKRKKDKS